jgi:hypothetical protein
LCENITNTMKVKSRLRSSNKATINSYIVASPLLIQGIAASESKKQARVCYHFSMKWKYWYFNHRTGNTFTDLNLVMQTESEWVTYSKFHSKKVTCSRITSSEHLWISWLTKIWGDTFHHWCKWTKDSSIRCWKQIYYTSDSYCILSNCCNWWIIVLLLTRDLF